MGASWIGASVRRWPMSDEYRFHDQFHLPGRTLSGRDLFQLSRSDNKGTDPAADK